MIVLNDKLVFWGMRKYNICMNCGCFKETSMHFFVGCEFAKDWGKVGKELYPDYLGDSRGNNAEYTI